MIRERYDGLDLALRGVEQMEHEEKRTHVRDIGATTLDLEAPGPVEPTPSTGLAPLPARLAAPEAVPPGSGLSIPRALAAATVISIVCALGTWVAPRVHRSAAPKPVNPLVRKGLPDPALTPGEAGAPVREATDIPVEARDQVLADYGVPAGDPGYVVCRLIPTTLGGSDNPRNLFATTPWFGKLKARLDKRLTELVRSREITAEHARRELQTNWIKAVHGYYVRNYGHLDEQKAKQAEDTLPW